MASMQEQPATKGALRGHRSAYAFATALIVGVCVWQYWGRHFVALMGDDLVNLTDIASGKLASDFGQALFGVWSEKYRPVFQSYLGLTFQFFGYDTYKYVALNMVVHGLSALLLFGAVMRLTGGRVVLALLPSLLFAASRFSWYQTLQVTGAVEGVATLFFLAAIYQYARIRDRSDGTGRWLIILFWALACFTHERFLAFLPAVLLVPVALHKNWRSREVLVFWAAAIGVVAFNFGYKAVFGDGAVFVGTSGTRLDLDFARIAGFIGAAIANSVGFNFGPAYLSGQAMKDAPTFVWWVSSGLALLFAVSILGGLFVGLRKRASSRRLWVELLLLAVAFAGAVFVASITIRQEFRWLVSPYILAGIAAAIGLAQFRSRPLALGLAVLIAGLSGVQALHYRALERNVFFLQEQFEAERLHALLKQDLAKPQIFLVVENSDVQCHWTYGKGRYFRIYQHLNDESVRCILGKENLPLAAAASDARILSSQPSLQQTADITETTREWLQENITPGFDQDRMLARFNVDRVDPQTEVSTPSSRGGFAAEGWETDKGPVPALVLVSGFSAAIPYEGVKPGSEMRFSVGMPYKAAGRSRLWVAVEDGKAKRKEVWAQEFTPPQDGVTRLVAVRAPMPAGLKGRGVIHFGIETLTPDSSGHWAIFGNPRILIPAPEDVTQAGAPTKPVVCQKVADPPSQKRLTWCAPAPPQQ